MQLRDPVAGVGRLRLHARAAALAALEHRDLRALDEVVHELRPVVLYNIM